MKTEEIAAWLRLTSVDGIGGASQRKLLAAFGSPEAVFSAGESEVAKTLDNANKARALFHPESQQQDFQKIIDSAIFWLEKPHHHLLTLGEANYPPSLLEIPDPPTVLFVRGNVELLQHKGLSIVGSRSATPQGLQTAHDFAQKIADFGLSIISGLALGIDAAAHRGALDSANGATIAVIGTGINRMYPKSNQKLTLDLLHKGGAIVSEFRFDTAPLPANFPRRNRLIAGLCLGVLVVEANLKSGSLITARLAAEMGREVFAVPGAIQNPFSRGTHQLIKDGARLADCVEDILEVLDFAPYIPQKNAQTSENPRSTENNFEKNSTSTVENCNNAEHSTTQIADSAEKPSSQTDAKDSQKSTKSPAPSKNTDDSDDSMLLQAMGYGACDIDTLAERTKMPTAQILSKLLMLEFSGKIATLAGGYYQRLK